ncbi:MAG TPA: hypothetical protein VE686_04005 [Beijerinckiaceae bacterium]|nr:hypothetical protein [Beijerinckiaceae bacterium]
MSDPPRVCSRAAVVVWVGVSLAPIALLYALFGAGSRIGFVLFFPTALGVLAGWAGRRKISVAFPVIVGSLGTGLLIVGIAQLGAGPNGDTTADEVIFLPLGLLLILVASAAAAVTAGGSLRRLQREER